MVAGRRKAEGSVAGFSNAATHLRSTHSRMRGTQRQAVMVMAATETTQPNIEWHDMMQGKLRGFCVEQCTLNPKPNTQNPKPSAVVKA